jgi:transposase-like protein
MMTAFFPPILPEEPIGHYHDRIEGYAGIGSCRPIRTEHLGAPSRSVDLRLPRNLNCLMQALTVVFPRMQLWDLVSLHTDYPYYAASLSEPARVALLARMCDYKRGPLRPLRALPGEDAFSARPLWCPACKSEDEKAFGCAYIHRYSTLPCVEICPIHGIPLMPKGTPEAESFPIVGGALANTLHFCRASCDLLLSHQPTYHLQDVKSLLSNAGLLTKAGRIRVRSLTESVVLSYEDGFVQPTLTALTHDIDAIKAWLKQAMAPDCHPVYHLLLIGGLCRVTKHALQLPVPPFPSEKYARALESVRHGVSVRSASKSIGVTDNTLLRRVRAARIPYCVRAKRLFSAQQREILSSLVRGGSIADICRAHGVSVSSVYRILASSPDAQRERRQALRTQLTKRYRAAWICLVDANPHARRTELCQLEAATWTWLRRHDRIWLNEHEPLPERGGSPRTKSQPSGVEEAEAIARLRGITPPLGRPRPLTTQGVLDAAGIPSAAHARLLRSESYRAELTHLVCGSHH